MKELLKLVNKKLFWGMLLFGIIYSLAETGQSLGIAHFATSPLTENKILYLIICYFTFDIIRWSSNWGSSYAMSLFDMKSKTTIQKYYLGKIEQMKAKNLTLVHTGFLQNLVEEATYEFLNVVWFLGSLISVVIGLIAFLTMACKQSVWTGVVCIILFILSVWCKYKMMQANKKYDKITREKRSTVQSTFFDFVQNVITIKKLNIRNYCLDKMDRQNEEYIKIGRKFEIKRANMNIAFHLLTSLVYVVVLVSTYIMAKNGGDALPYLLFYLTLIGNVYGDLNGVVYLIDRFIRFNTAKKQLDEKLGELENLKLIRDFKRIELRNVTFKYNNSSLPILIPDFVIKKGDKIVITGESGQGKTTAMNILAGLYEGENGELLIDGKEYKNSKLDLAFVSQEVELFDVSVRENLCLGKEIPEGKILELLDDAGLTEWYNNLENGLDTLVGEKGVKLSAGQKQRLNLIRGILIDKDLYFFDEPTSNLDSVSEEKITNMIEKYLKDKTYVIVTHRPKLKDLCNKHYVFENHIMKETINV